MSTICKLCGKEEQKIASVLGVCPTCARKTESRTLTAEVHRQSLKSFGLGMTSKSGVRCGQCVNDCHLDNGERGVCGLRINHSGSIQPILTGRAVVDWYYDPIPTNCVAEWNCPAKDKSAIGKKSLAVFFHGCTFDCLYCQNWHSKEGLLALRPQRSVDHLIRSADPNTFCVCFFGGDPTPQLQYAIEACDKWLNRDEKAPRICWETNGSMSSPLAHRIAEISLGSGGTVKFDLKAFDENLHYALCGASNRQTLQNFRRLAARLGDDVRNILVASTLLVPGYVDAREIERIANFISDLDPAIPYSLLAFHPDYLMMDIPTTSLAEANEALSVAKKAGLENVHIGNIHLLY